MGRLEHEELRVVLLNTKNIVLRVVTVYQGNVSSSLVRVGDRQHPIGIELPSAFSDLVDERRAGEILDEIRIRKR